ncbi:MAG: TIGR03643 family protein [Flavobacteriaceae bacterium]
MAKDSLTLLEKDRIIEMAWEDRTPFDAITLQFGLSEQQVIRLMRRELRASSFRLWRKRVQGRSTKHLKKRSFEKGRFKCNRQRAISQNKVSKR